MSMFSLADAPDLLGGGRARAAGAVNLELPGLDDSDDFGGGTLGGMGLDDVGMGEERKKPKKSKKHKEKERKKDKKSRGRSKTEGGHDKERKKEYREEEYPEAKPKPLVKEPEPADEPEIADLDELGINTGISSSYFADIAGMGDTLSDFAGKSKSAPAEPAAGRRARAGRRSALDDEGGASPEPERASPAVVVAR